MFGFRGTARLRGVDGVRDPDGQLPVEIGHYSWVGDQWMVMDPSGCMTFLGPTHVVLIHEDGTITVNPSIVSADYHGFLEDGGWTINTQPWEREQAKTKPEKKENGVDDDALYRDRWSWD